MFRNLLITKKHLNAILILGFAFAATQSFGQDTLAGNYPLLSIKSGNHVIKSVVTVKGKLDIAAGARIELIEPGIIVCEGAVNILGELNNKIEIFGKTNMEGVGMVIRGLDSISNSNIDISIETNKGYTASHLALSGGHNHLAHILSTEARWRMRRAYLSLVYGCPDAAGHIDRFLFDEMMCREVCSYMDIIFKLN
jgi:hypothetical protein